MPIRSLFILMGIALLALEPCLPPATMGGVQKQDLSASCPIKGLCGMACCCSGKEKPSLCAGSLPAGLYAAGCVPLNGKGFFFSNPVAKWMPTRLALVPPGLSLETLVISDSLLSLQAEPISPPPRV
jgi:hypothetical protein